MNKTAIKNFAIWARKKLIEGAKYKASLVGITDAGILDALPQSNKDVEYFDIGMKEPYALTGNAIKQRKSLIKAITEKQAGSDYVSAYNEIMEEVAYTWFNRLIAVRFMEVNDYLPYHIRVLSSSDGRQEPEIIRRMFDAGLEYSNSEIDYLLRLKSENEYDKLFHHIFIKQCNALNKRMPYLFEKTADYTELLFNASYISKDSLVYRLVNDIPESNFDVTEEGQVEIIGWFYQYYNTELKDETFAQLKKNIKINKERIPAATQLFTPDWIVKYMVENSLGRLWLEGHPNDLLKSKWRYYLDETEQEDSVKTQLANIREESKKLNPEDIKIIDPCMGSGHILVYIFDVLMQIYLSRGWSKHDAVNSILANNLYGLDIDDRAFQLAYFAVMMKAREYDRHILDSKITCHLYSIQESNNLNRTQLHYFGSKLTDTERNEAIEQISELLDAYHDAKEYGSIIDVKNYSWDLLFRFVDAIFEEESENLAAIGILDTKNKLTHILEIGQIMSQKYDIVVTNPPYMGSSGMSSKLSDFVKKNYPDSKSDLFSCCIEKGIGMIKTNGYNCMVTMQSWMFLSSFEKMRKKIVSSHTIINLMHMENMVMGIAFGTAVTIFRNLHISGYKGTYNHMKLEDIIDDVPKNFPIPENRFAQVSADNFSKIPGSPIAYWVNEQFIENYGRSISISSISDYTGSQNITADNEKYLRFSWEVERARIGPNKKWVVYAKGGNSRKYYGNLIHIIDWSDDARNFYKTNKTSNLLDERYWYKEGITYTMLSSKGASFRYLPEGCIFDKGGPSIISLDDNLQYVLGFLNSQIAKQYLSIMNPTINLQVKDVNNLPLIIDDSKFQAITNIVSDLITHSKIDWNFNEYSIDYSVDPLVSMKCNKLSEAIEANDSRIRSIRSAVCLMELKLNEMFNDIYSLNESTKSSIDCDDIDHVRDIKKMISYAVGCMFGRYSLDVDGLAYAGGNWDSSKYATFIPDENNVIPITDEDYFQDDIVGLFCAWLKKVYGPDTLNENLEFIARTLGNKGNSPREIIRNYFLKDFFKDHCKIYQKRPIYWLYDSGKENGFKALIYMHRYNENTSGIVRADYLHRIERIYEHEIERMDEAIKNNEGSSKASRMKRKEKLTKQLNECKEYDIRLANIALSRISIDLDDGVKINYDKVQTNKDGKNMKLLAELK